MNRSRFSGYWAVLLVAVAGLAMSGCGGGGAKVHSSNTTTTIGQELMDLDRAYSKGIIDKEQYERSKRQVLERYDD